jgi:WD40 repeat protein
MPLPPSSFDAPAMAPREATDALGPPEVGEVAALRRRGVGRPVRPSLPTPGPLRAIALAVVGDRVVGAMRHPDLDLPWFDPPEGELDALAVWDLATSQRLEWSAGQQVAALAARPGHDEVVAVGSDGRFTRWRVGARLALVACEELADARTGLAVSPDGARAYACGVDGAVHAWSLDDAGAALDGARDAGAALDGARDAGALRLLHRAGAPLFAIAVSPDGAHLAVVSAEDVRVLCARTGAQVSAFASLGTPHTRVAFVDDERLMVVGVAGGSSVAPDGTPIVYEGPTALEVRALDGDVRISFDGHTEQPTAALVLPDGLVASSGWDGPVRIWRAATGEPVRALHGQPRPSQALAWDARRGRLLSASDAPRVQTWSLAAPEGAPHARMGSLAAPEDAPRGHTDLVTELRWLEGGARFASSSFDGTVRVWDARTGACLATAPHGARILSLAACAGGRVLYVVGEDGLVHRWNLDDTLHGFAVVELPRCQEVAVDAAGDTLLAVSSAGELLVRRAEDAPLRRVQLPGDEPILCMQLATDGRRAILGGYEGAVVAVDVARGTARALGSHGGLVVGLALLDDGARAVSVGADGSIAVWSLSGRAPARRLEVGHPVGSARLLADGRLVTGGEGGAITLWDLDRGARVAALEGPTSHVGALAADRRARWLAAGTASGTCTLWDLATLRAVGAFRGEEAIQACLVAEDGTLVLGDAAGDVAVTEAP